MDKGIQYKEEKLMKKIILIVLLYFIGCLLIPCLVTLAIGDMGKYSDALNALVVLGYSRTEATDALKGLDYSSLSLEDMITAALKNLMR